MIFFVNFSFPNLRSPLATLKILVRLCLDTIPKFSLRRSTMLSFFRLSCGYKHPLATGNVINSSCGRIPSAMPIFTFHNLRKSSSPALLISARMEVNHFASHWWSLENSRILRLMSHPIVWRDNALTFRNRTGINFWHAMFAIHSLHHRMVGANINTVLVIITRIPSDNDGLRCPLRIGNCVVHRTPLSSPRESCSANWQFVRFEFQAWLAKL